MKSLFLMMALLITMFISSAALAQNGQIGTSPNSNSGANTVTVNIILKDIQSVIVQTGQNSIDLIYNSESNYTDGVKVNKSGHLKAFSTQDYVITSSVWQENLITQQDIYLNDILQSRQFKELHRANKGSNLIDVEYGAKGNNEYLNKDKKTYTTQVIYAIIPQ